MAEYPDDESCLVALWHERYSPDGEHAYCPSPSCKTERTFKRYATTATAPVVDLHGLRPPPAPDRGDDLPQVVHVAAASGSTCMYLMTSTRCGISAKQVERELGCSVQDRHADDAADPYRVDERTRRRHRTAVGRGRSGRNLRRREAPPIPAHCRKPTSGVGRCPYSPWSNERGSVRAEVLPTLGARRSAGSAAHRHGERQGRIGALHRRVAVVLHDGRSLRPPLGEPLAPRVHARCRAHADHRRVLLDREGRTDGRVPRRVAPLVAVLHERVLLPVQPPRTMLATPSRCWSRSPPAPYGERCWGFDSLHAHAEELTHQDLV